MKCHQFWNPLNGVSFFAPNLRILGDPPERGRKGAGSSARRNEGRRKEGKTERRKEGKKERRKGERRKEREGEREKERERERVSREGLLTMNKC